MLSGWESDSLAKLFAWTMLILTAILVISANVSQRAYERRGWRLEIRRDGKTEESFQTVGPVRQEGPIISWRDSHGLQHVVTLSQAESAWTQENP